MKPYYEHQGIEIYHADARDCYELFSRADVCLTDPPYGIGGSFGTINKQRAKGEYASAFDDTRLYISSVVIPIVSVLIAKIGCVALTPGSRNIDLYPQAASFGVFYQPASVGLQTFGNMDAQPILYYGKNATCKNMGVPCSYQLTEAPPKFAHPCIKPTKAWKRLLSNIALADHTILDPFMGSGTTLVVAKELGMKAIGIELEERYAEIAAKRLSQQVMDLF